MIPKNKPINTFYRNRKFDDFLHLQNDKNSSKRKRKPIHAKNFTLLLLNEQKLANKIKIFEIESPQNKRQINRTT